MKVERFNHLVLTVQDIETTCDFYHDLLGMEVETFSIRGKSLKFGNQKISLREKRREFEETDQIPTPGVIDICFIVTETIEQVKAELENKNIKIQGIVERSGAAGKTYSVYFRDPDQNLIEVCNHK
ncbi:MAG TPA: VOC family protein [Mucilaginibacter sp.]|jgi:catechol 2,3-dioxygenase-like lactoylglutathione lyase family enzyme|nr:VOC family protein [Mucilaginibacter sp.]